MVRIPSPMLGTGTVRARKPPEYRTFYLQYTGPRGGKREIKVRLKLLGGDRGDILSHNSALRVQERARDKGYLTRLVEWWKTENQGFTGILIYGIKIDDLVRMSEFKQGGTLPWVIEP